MQNTLELIRKKYNIQNHNKTVQIEIDRSELPKLFLELGFKTGAEIGTDRGLYAEELCRVGLSLFCIDPWKAYEEYPSRESQHDFNINCSIATKRLMPYNNAVIIKKTSLEAVNDIEDNSLDFVYIDGNHDFKYVLQDITEWTKKVKPGGIVCGDDYDWYHKGKLRTDVKDAVTTYLYMNTIDNLFLFKKDRAVNWLFIK